MSTNDATLLERWRLRRDAEAFNEIVSRYADLVYATCKRVLKNEADAEDVTQECFVRLARGDVRVRSCLGGWFHRVAFHRSLNLRTQEAQRWKREREASMQAAQSAERSWSDIQEYVDEAIDALSPGLREVVVTHFLERQSYQAIASRHGRSKRVVAYRVKKGIEAIRRHLRKRGIIVGAPALGPLFAANFVEAAPASVATALGKLALAGTAAAQPLDPRSSGQHQVTRGTAMKWKLATATSLALLTAAGVIAVYISYFSRPPAVEPAVTAARVVNEPREPADAAGVPRDDREPTADGEGSQDARADEDILLVLCVDEEGRALAEAEVYLAEDVWREKGKELSDLNVVGPIRTDTEGIARFGDVPRLYPAIGWRRSVYARVPGELSGIGTEHYSHRNPETLPEGALEVVLSESSDVGGVVRVPEGFRPEEVTVRVMGMYVANNLSIHFDRNDKRYRHLWPEIFEVNPDPEGNFGFDDLPSGSRIYLAAESLGLGQAQFMSDEPRKLRQIEFDLVAEGSIEGTLTYKDTAEPASGYTLFAHPQGFVPVRIAFETVVRETGRFRFTGLPTEAFCISAYDISKKSEWTMAVKGLVQVSAGETVEGVDLQLERGALVSGLVTDALTGVTLPGVGIAALNGPHHRMVGIDWATTDVSGHYELRLPVGQSKLYYQGIPKGYVRSRDSGATFVDVLEGQTERDGVDFQLTPESPADRSAEERVWTYGSVRGRVLGPDGNPVEGTAVKVTPRWTTGSNLDAPRDPGLLFNYNRRTSTDVDGRYELSLIAGAKYRISSGGGEFSAVSSREFSLSADQVYQVEDLHLGQGESFVEGLVVDPLGEPIAGATVGASAQSESGAIFNDESQTDEQGGFRLEHLLAGRPLAMTAYKLGYEHRNWNGVAPETPGLRFVLHPLPHGRALPGDENKQIHRAEEMLGRPAPAWDVGQWVQDPEAPARPDRGDGRRTVLLYEWSNEDWSKLGPKLQRFEEICERAGAVPVLLLSSPAHESAVRPAIEKYNLKLGVGIDRYVPLSEYSTPNATMIQYGWGEMPLVFIIDTEGIIRHVKSGLDGLEKSVLR